MFRITTIIAKSIVHQIVQVRCLYGVQHNAKRQIFYVRLKDYETAVLSYKADGRILDMQSINVPRQHQGRGLARLLAEAAFTYAIVHDYYMLLSCEYMQKFYRATRSPELEERVIGPLHILNGIEAAELDSESVDSLPDPEQL